MLSKVIKRLVIAGWSFFFSIGLYAQRDTLCLNLQHLFERGTKQHL